MSSEWSKIVANNPLLHSLFNPGKMSAQKGKAYCRLCAESNTKDKMLDLQMDFEKKAEISNKLSRINAYADFDNETFPTTVCLMCLNTLDKAFDFVTNIEKAHAVLRDIFIVQQIKTEVPQSDSDSNDASSQDTPDEVKQGIANIKVELKQKEDTLKSPEAPRKAQKAPKKNAKVKVHQKLSWKSFDWTCSYCETQFPSAEELVTHSIQYHGSCNAFRCPDCNRRKLRLESFMIHVKRHRKSLKFSCYRCFKQCSSARETNIHKLNHLTTAHVCPGCNTCFESNEEMRAHADTYFKPKKVREILPTGIDEDGLTCRLCNKTFKYRGNLNTHLLKHTERNRDHTCEICGKTFLSKYNLAGHMLVHSDVRPYQCEICKQAFKTPHKLRTHVGVHDGHKPYSCDQCGRCFRLHKQLLSHSIIHTDLLPFVCSYCDKRFRFKTILNQHIRQHTGVKPYSCEICHREFTNWPNYNKHMKARHNMDMAKKKHTPEGLYPINPVTGALIMHPETNSLLEWKKKMMATRRGPGRPRAPKVDEENNMNNIESPTVEENNINNIVVPIEHATNETNMQLKQE